MNSIPYQSPRLAEDRGRLALFVPSLNVGGAQRMTLNLVRGAAGRGLGVDLVLCQAVGLFSGGGRVRMVTAALARLDFPGNDWSRIDFGLATLAWLITPKLLGVDED